MAEETEDSKWELERKTGNKMFNRERKKDNEEGMRMGKERKIKGRHDSGKESRTQEKLIGYLRKEQALICYIYVFKQVETFFMLT